jgi:hypothetical protein
MNEDLVTALAFLIKKGLLLEIEYSTLYLGRYSELKHCSFTPVKRK